LNSQHSTSLLQSFSVDVSLLASFIVNYLTFLWPLSFDPLLLPDTLPTVFNILQGRFVFSGNVLP
jgi:hypothetical protein